MSRPPEPAGAERMVQPATVVDAVIAGTVIGYCTRCGGLVYPTVTIRTAHEQWHTDNDGARAERDERIAQLEATVAALAAGLLDPGKTPPPKGKP